MKNKITKKERSSNFELLRVFATLLILFNHYIVDGFGNIDVSIALYIL